jgi:hypothetical protein
LVCLLLALSSLLTACGEGPTTVKRYYDRPNDSDSVRQLKVQYNVMPGDSSRKHGTFKAFYPNGQLKIELAYKMGKPWVVYQQFDQEGQPREVSTLQNGNGLLKTFDYNGQPVSKIRYAHGLPEGPAQFYGTGGQVSSRVHYAGGVAFSRNDLSEGAGPAPGGSFAAQSNSSDTTAADSADTLQSRMAAAGSGNSSVNMAAAKQVLQQFQARKTQQLANNFAAPILDQQGLEAVKRYLDFISTIYGELERYERMQYGLKSHPRFGEMLQVAYKCKFSYCQAGLILAMLREGGQFRPLNISVQAAAYTPITEIREACDPVMDRLKQEQWDALYQNASAKLREKVSKEQFQQKVNQYESQGEISSYTLRQHRVGLAQGSLTIDAVYEAQVSGETEMVEMLMIKEDGAFKLLTLMSGAQQPKGRRGLQQMPGKGQGMPQMPGGGGGAPGMQQPGMGQPNPHN